MTFTTAANGGTTDDLKPPSDECSIDAGLFAAEKLVLDHSEGAKAKAAWDRLSATAQQYNINIKRDDLANQISRIPVFAVRKQAQTDLQTVESSMRDLKYVEGIEALRALNQVSLMIYATHRADLNAQAANQAQLKKNFGATWEAQLKVSDEKTKRLAGVIRVLEEKVPSDSMIESKEIEDSLRNIGEAP